MDQIDKLELDVEHNVITLFSIMQTLRQKANFYTVKTIHYGIVPDNGACSFIYAQCLCNK